MKPLVLTNLDGEARKLNPLAVIGWGTATSDLPDGTKRRRGFVVTAGGRHEVQEGEEEIDRLWTEAVAPT